MGLDMYLYEKQTHQVAYWRKANAIHNWIINYAGVEDNCQPIELTRQDLIQLRNVCTEVLTAHTEEVAMDLLPPASGFFFGGTAVDEWYWDILEETVTLINTALDETVDDAMFEYLASW